MKNIIFILSIIFIFIEESNSQNYSFYLKMKKNEDSITISKNKSLLPSFDSKNLNIKKILRENPNIEIERPFSEAKSTFLKNVYLVKVKTENVLNEFKKNKSEISHLEELIEPQLIGFIPNDYGINPPYNQVTHLELIKANQAWELFKDYPKIPTALTDTRFNPNHEDMSGRYLSIYGSNTSTQDHGEYTASILAALSNNGKGLTSVAYDAKVYASTIWGSDAEILRIAKLGYRVINASWLNSCSYSAVQDALYTEIRDVWNAVVVSGAGNSHCFGRWTKVYPAAYDAVLCVSSVGDRYPIGRVDPDPLIGNYNWKDCHEINVGDSTSSFHHYDAVDIVAPGFNIPVTTLSTNGYIHVGGTSSSAPMVAGAASVLLSINPCLTAVEVINILKTTADASIYNIPQNSRYIGKLGSGRLDVYKAAIEAAKYRHNKIQNINFNSNTITNSGYIDIGKTVTNLIPYGGVNVNSGYTWTINAREVLIKDDFEVKLGGVLEINTSATQPVSCP